jgi:hypothetical protein
MDTAMIDREIVIDLRDSALFQSLSEIKAKSGIKKRVFTEDERKNILYWWPRTNKQAMAKILKCDTNTLRNAYYRFLEEENMKEDQHDS